MRFDFGKNWSRFIKLIDQLRIQEAERSLKEMLQIREMKDTSFLDIGSGSGLFSLSARRLGASVFSFDNDQDSVDCTEELRRRYYPNDKTWIIQKGSILDSEYIASLEKFDIVYSWGVLHHTGKMWEALSNSARLVKTGGLLYIALYNDQGWKSRLWKKIKITYNYLPVVFKQMFSILMFASVNLLNFIKYSILLRPWIPIISWVRHKKKRGMNIFIDWRDWIGGYPYEVASPEIVYDHMNKYQFELIRIKRTSSLGCNEFLFRRKD